MHKDRGTESILYEVHRQCKEAEENGTLKERNYVKGIYEAFTPEEISAKIAELITPGDVHVPVEVLYQNIEDLHASCPTNTGDWYFTGNYPTPGGNKVVNKAYINYVEGINSRGY